MVVFPPIYTINLNREVFQYCGWVTQVHGVRDEEVRGSTRGWSADV